FMDQRFRCAFHTHDRCTRSPFAARCPFRFVVSFQPTPTMNHPSSRARFSTVFRKNASDDADRVLLQKPTRRSAVGRGGHRVWKPLIGSIAALLLCGTPPAFAGSATWLPFPGSGDWNNALNWSEGGPPNGPFDTAF